MLTDAYAWDMHQIGAYRGCIKVKCTVLGGFEGELGTFSAGTKNQGYGVDFWIIVHTLTDMLKT